MSDITLTPAGNVPLSSAMGDGDSVLVSIGGGTRRVNRSALSAFLEVDYKATKGEARITATAGQTAFTFDHETATISVYVNGLRLQRGVDYTTDGEVVTLLSAAELGDVFEAEWFGAFAVPTSGRNDVSRSLFVVAVANGYGAADGTVVSAGGLFYVASAGATAIADLPGWLPFGFDYYPDHFAENTTPGTTDMQPAVQALADWLIGIGRPWKFLFLGDSYFFGSGVDLTAADQPFEIEGVREGTAIVAGNFGAANEVFKTPERTAGAIRRILFTAPASGDKRTPIGLKMPRVSRITLDEIRSSGFGNTVIWASSAFNCDWRNLDLFFSGYQPIHKEVSSNITLALTSGSDVVTASEAVFDASDVGKVISLQYFASGQRSEGLFAKIDSVASSTSATLSQASNKTLAAAKFSFTAVRGAINSGSTALTAQSAIFDADDLGRYVYIPGAGADGGVLAATVETVSSSTQVVLSEAASVTVSDRQIYFTPAIYLGKSDVSETPINDVQIDHALIEGYRGPGIITNRGTHVYLNNLKTHGRSWANNGISNFGYSGHPMIWGGTLRGSINGWECEFPAADLTRGSIAFIGEFPNLTISGMTVSGPGFGSPLFSFTPATPENSGLTINGLACRVPWNDLGGILHTDTFRQRQRVRGHDIMGNSSSDETNAQLSLMAGGFRSMEPLWMPQGESFTFNPAVDAGILAVSARDTSSYSGLIAFRCYQNNGGTDLITGGANLAVSGTTGLVITASATGTITLKNNSGDRFFVVTVIG